MNVNVVTISRLTGTDGDTIASGIAERLGFRLLDREVIAQAAREAGVSEDRLSAAEHAITLRERIVTALSASPGIPGAGMYLPPATELAHPVRVREYRTLIDAVVADLPGRGQFVVLGHAGQVVLADRWDTLKVLVTGSKRLRTLAVRCEQGLDAEEAGRFVETSDRDRANYLREHHGIDWLAPDLYDLCVNTDHIPVRRAVDLICDEALHR